MIAVYICLGHKEYAVDLTARGVLIGLASIIAVCGVALLWVDRKSVASSTLSNGIWFFGPTMATVHWKLCSLQ
jgi:hypothetical protein